jgi:hypothetical protein
LTRGLPLLVSAAFFLSGAAGLVYQVAWQRILALHSGVGAYSVAMIVAAFMAGLGLGSRLGGALSARLSRGQALAGFGLLELAIASFGTASCALYYDFLFERAARLYASPWLAGLLHFLALLLPTTAMGMTLPLLTRASVREAAAAGGVVGRLYGINILGASLGALLTPWLLVRHWGLRGAVLAAAGANLAAGLTALVALGFAARGVALGEEVASRSDDASERAVHAPFELWLALYALSGFVALALEVLWFRLLDLAVKSTAFTFGTMLAFYLLGTGLGCLLGIPLARRLARPLRAFLLCQCLLLVYAGLAVLLLAGLPSRWPLYDWYVDYWGRGMGFGLGDAWDAVSFGRLYLLLPAALFLPATVLMGLSFPALQRAVHDDARSSGRKVGLLQAANIAGCVAGSLLVGLLALQRVGTTGSLRLLLGLGLVFAGVGLRLESSRRLFGALALTLASLALALPGQQRLWSRLHGSDDPGTLVDEDATGVGAVTPARGGRGYAVFFDGKNHSSVPFGGVHSRLGATPALLHPAPLDVAIIGLGSGDTAWAAGCRPETRTLAVFEIASPLPRLLSQLARREELPDLRGLLADPRLRVRIADGRSALRHSGVRYDLIEADALWPHVAGSGNLYSVEFFAECARVLKPGGMMCTWSPTARILFSFSRAFRYVLSNANGTLLLGSNHPLPTDVGPALRRLESESVSAYLGPGISHDVAGTLKGLRPVRPARHAPTWRLNEDLYPRDEFRVR